MHKPALIPLIYNRLFPNPRPTDPASFETYITLHLVPEVRSETVRFYGPIDCIEAQYPGLDYTSKAHRTRLSGFPFHRRLFRAFDDLRLIDSEILSICHWEGTLWAREIYEQRTGIKIRDTTFDGIPPHYARHPTATVTQIRGGESSHGVVTSDREDVSDDEDEDEEMNKSDGQIIEEDEQESEDELQTSVGVELNQRLLAATEARARGEEVVLDAAWEQWLKEAAERDETPSFPPLMRAGPSRQAVLNPSQWGQAIPEVFRYGPGDVPPPQVDALRAQMPPPPFLPQIHSDAGLDAAATSIPSTGAAI